jgi:hypothetical protein
MPSRYGIIGRVTTKMEKNEKKMMWKYTRDTKEVKNAETLPFVAILL